MKELSIEEKARRYDEAIERANELNYVSDKDSLQCKTVEHIFPELAESEDERIRKNIIKAFKIFADKQTWVGHCLDDIDWDACIAWLEKQGEQKDSVHRYFEGFKHGEECVVNNYGKYGLQKATEWSEEDNETLDRIISNYQYFCKELFIKDGLTEVEKEVINNVDKEDIDWLESLKDRVQPKQEWSEEDEKMLEELLNYCDTSIQYNGINSPQAIKWKKRKEWFKNLKDKYAWKPSKEQIEALETTLYSNMSRNDERYSVLSEFVAELKKLREE